MSLIANMRYVGPQYTYRRIEGPARESFMEKLAEAAPEEGLLQTDEHDVRRIVKDLARKTDTDRDELAAYVEGFVTGFFNSGAQYHSPLVGEAEERKP